MDKKIVDIGTLPVYRPETNSGKILLYGGVYSNLQALEKLISIAQDKGIAPQNCICTGDIVGYCAQPEETVQLYKEWGTHGIAGNVEKQLSNGAEDCGCDFEDGSRCDSFSQLWYPYAQSKLSKDSLDVLSKLPDHITFTFAGKKVTVVHGSYRNISEFIFKSTDWEIKKSNFTKTNSDVIIAGHCGLPFHSEEDGKLWLNPGVIGMPANDGHTEVWYAIMDETDGKITFEHHTFAYDHHRTSALMNNGLLPQEYAKTILTGIWDNTDILPPKESGAQGQEIDL